MPGRRGHSCTSSGSQGAPGSRAVISGCAGITVPTAGPAEAVSVSQVRPSGLHGQAIKSVMSNACSAHAIIREQHQPKQSTESNVQNACWASRILPVTGCPPRRGFPPAPARQPLQGTPQEEGEVRPGSRKKLVWAAALACTLASSSGENSSSRASTGTMAEPAGSSPAPARGPREHAGWAQQPCSTLGRAAKTGEREAPRDAHGRVSGHLPAARPAGAAHPTQRHAAARSSGSRRPAPRASPCACRGGGGGEKGLGGWGGGFRRAGRTRGGSGHPRCRGPPLPTPMFAALGRPSSRVQVLPMWLAKGLDCVSPGGAPT